MTDLIGLVFILFLSVNTVYAQQELYTFDADNVDKIIMDAEKCLLNNDRLNVCDEIIKTAQEQMALKQSQLLTCEENLVKKDQLYKDIFKLKDDQLKICEDNSKKKDETIIGLQENVKDVQKVVDDQKKKDMWSNLWTTTKWSTGALIVGLLLGLLI